MSKTPDCFDHIYINDIYWYAKNCNKKSTEITFYTKLISIAVLMISILITICLVIINLPFYKKLNKTKKIALARVSRVSYKIKKYNNQLFIITDDIKGFDFTLFRVVARRKMLFFIFLEMINLCKHDYRLLLEDINQLDEPTDKRDLLKKFTFRIPHTVLYKFVINQIIKDYDKEEIITGQMFDRFALIEEDICKYYGIKLICIPHGVEITLKMPRQYVGDLFYCTSNYMKNMLTSIYKSTKYQYDENIVRKIYQKEIKNSSINKKVVFFTQPRETEKTIQIIKLISERLVDSNIRMYIKVHPLENRNIYKDLSLISITSFDEAVTNSVCISLSSTSLLEAIYNDSISISIINLLNKDITIDGKYSFLYDKRIHKPNSIDEVIKLVQHYY
ncbi:MAG: hypothetical protein E7L18_05535 [Finegoldia magna]|uniref:hypothetical protein n=1 Tax=Finegoldia magna TaxID=1260 RepID=UPI002908DE9C|nr:hypothetical protein [Finegoldia magna]MDU7330950.1 hypothetical protein [Finegoldia magna]